MTACCYQASLSRLPSRSGIFGQILLGELAPHPGKARRSVLEAEFVAVVTAQPRFADLEATDPAFTKSLGSTPSPARCRCPHRRGIHVEPPLMRLVLTNLVLKHRSTQAYSRNSHRALAISKRDSLPPRVICRVQRPTVGWITLPSGGSQSAAGVWWRACLTTLPSGGSQSAVGRLVGGLTKSRQSRCPSDAHRPGELT